MADQEKKQEQPYQFVPEGGEPTNSSKDFTGKGTATYPNGQIYEGQYVNGVRQGKGKYTYSNGDATLSMAQVESTMLTNLSTMGNGIEGENMGKVYVYSGQWVNGKKHGQGTYVFNATSMKYVGEWFESKFLTGKWVYPNGTYFEGQFQNNKPKGAGIWNFENENKLQGNYDQLITTGQNNNLQTQLMWVHK